MDYNLPDEHVIREYLLGTLPEQDWDEIEEKLLSDKKLADFADSIEDDIIEEYLTIQNHFLRPPERQRKLLFAKILHSRLKKREQVPVSIETVHRKPTGWTIRTYRTLGLAAAAALLCLTLPLGVFTATLYSAVKTARADSNQANSQLAQASSQVVVLRNELGLRANPDVKFRAAERGIQKAPEFAATAATKSILVYIQLDSSQSSSYHAELQVTHGTESDSKALWTADKLQPTDTDLLVIDVPYGGPGRYSLKVTPTGQDTASTRTYRFSVILI